MQRRDLRQLAQRITARYHLLALNPQEVVQYIKHRLSVAECFRDIFSVKAMAAVHQISGGVPRIINLVCERALINAYGSNNTTVDKKTILQAAQEALGEEYSYQPWWQHKSVKFSVLSVLMITLLGGGYFIGQRGFLQTNHNEN